MNKKNFNHKMSYVAVVLSVIAVSLIGGSATSGGMDWYNKLNLPAFTPPGSFIGLVWTIIFVLTAFSIILFLKNNKKKKEVYFNCILLLFVLNGLLNILWSFVFFGRGLIFWSIVEMCFLNLSTLILIFLLWKKNKASSILIWPYFLWVSFATFLAYSIYLLN